MSFNSHQLFIRSSYREDLIEDLMLVFEDIARRHDGMIDFITPAPGNRRPRTLPPNCEGLHRKDGTHSRGEPVREASDSFVTYFEGVIRLKARRNQTESMTYVNLFHLADPLIRSPQQMGAHGVRTRIRSTDEKHKR